MGEEVLEMRIRILGEEHPDTISAMVNLANTLRDLGQLDEAAEIEKEEEAQPRRGPCRYNLGGQQPRVYAY
jgi:hypothetical protein